MRLPKPPRDISFHYVGTELLLHLNGQAHCLSGPAVTVFNACHQSQSLEELAAEFKDEEEPERFALEVLAQLQEKGLVAGHTKLESRRLFLGRTALRAAALGAILTVTAPRPAAAGS